MPFVRWLGAVPAVRVRVRCPVWVRVRVPDGRAGLRDRGGVGVRAYGFVETGGPEKQAFLDVPVPDPGPGELLVRVRAAGVNPGDWRLREGAYGTVGPAVLGREVAGTVQ